MDRSLAALERAWRDARDLDAARELAQLRLRAGRPRAALSLARVCDPALREQAAVALARAAQLELEALDEVEVFRLGERRLHLIPGGLFLNEPGEHAETSLVGPGGRQRAPLRPEFVADLLVARDAQARAHPLVAREAARALGGRLPTPAEWKKAWRGGLYLAGDEAEQRPNPSPDRLSPYAWGSQPGSVYGLTFARDVWEHVAGDLVAMGYSAGRYQVPADTPDARRARHLVWRLVLELTALP